MSLRLHLSKQMEQGSDQEVLAGAWEALFPTTGFDRTDFERTDFERTAFVLVLFWRDAGRESDCVNAAACCRGRSHT